MSIKSGLTAGFAATVVLSVLMMMKHAMGLMPEVNPIGDIVHLADAATGQQLPMIAGWVGHFAIGTVAWGILYSILQSALPGGAVVKGAVFGVLAWLAMMVLFMPLAGHGLFAMKLGVMAMMATLMLHLIYGIVLGVVYAKSQGGAARADVMPG
ncbi:MAG TPA: hypothetical protein P5024_06955 [Burkholderiaceae bacterium]|nr:hypothetical protein [Burkholderiaceae bacterium]HPE02936.1 hypothetical protein [Burkholderiaceae bacterium]HRZ01278.1 hypothetical protein [Burkholderiaceae bacterium]